MRLELIKHDCERAVGMRVRVTVIVRIRLRLRVHVGLRMTVKVLVRVRVRKKLRSRMCVVDSVRRNLSVNVRPRCASNSLRKYLQCISLNVGALQVRTYTPHANLCKMHVK